VSEGNLVSTPLSAGTRLRSAVCDTQVVVIRVDDTAAVVECGGVPMVPVADAVDTASAAPRAGFDGGTKIGKRYGSTEDVVELLCTKPGAGSLSVNGSLLALRETKPLPASD
jgi:hypothetical protein